jgi:hypothetical protein
MNRVSMRAMSGRAAGMLLTGLLTAGCASNSTPGANEQRGEGSGTLMASGHMCSAVDRDLGLDATLRERSGVYRLMLVLTSSDAGTRSTEGRLSLRLQPQRASDVEEAPPHIMGSTDIDVGAVDAYRVGDPASDDPDAPGVLVIESDGSGGRSILLRLGSDANRRDVVAFDGAYTVLTVRHMDSGGFAGSWRSATWDTRAEGYFCARMSAG